MQNPAPSDWKRVHADTYLGSARWAEEGYQRISLTLVMCGSILSMIMSILRTISIGEIANATVGTPDMQYSSSPQLTYDFAEQSIVIFMGCIPILRATKV